MEMTGEQLIALPHQATWDALNDTAVLMDCIPGCDSMEKQSDNEYLLTMTAKVGPVSATFTGVVKLSDIDPGRAVTISGEGKGGAAGYAKGGAKVTMVAVPEGTELSYTVDASVGGKIAQLGSRLIDGFAKKMADEFFTRFQDALETPEEGSDEAEAMAEGSEEAPKKGWFKRMIGA